VPHEYGWSDARCSIAPVLAHERLRMGMKPVFLVFIWLFLAFFNE
jgi:hypothetical protein